jgi:hypothetical protein
VKLILHIGTEKTGTTSIQKFLRNNMQNFYQDGIWIPSSIMYDNGNHGWFRFFGHNEGYRDEFTKTSFRDNDQAIKQFISGKRSDFLAELNGVAEKCHTAIVSSEHLSSRLRRTEEIKRLHEFCAQIFDKVSIIVYIRDPLHYAISSFSQILKGGFTPNELQSARNQKFQKHDLMIKSWKECFPGSEIIVKRFERGRLLANNIIYDFCATSIPGLNTEEYSTIESSNESLSLTGMAILRRLNFSFPRFIDGKPNPFWKGLSEAIQESTLDGTKYMPTREEFIDYQSFFAESNERVRSEYFSGEEFLFVRPEKFAEAKINLDNVVISREIYESIISSLWRNNVKMRESNQRLWRRVRDQA